MSKVKAIQITSGKLFVSFEPEISTIVDLDIWKLLQNHKLYTLPTPREKPYITLKLYDLKGQLKFHYLHRFIMGARAGEEVDHINGDTLDNRRSNLRLVSHRENQLNRRKLRKKTSSRFKGVYWASKPKKWAANITIKGKCHYLGLFETEEAAARAYNEAATREFGEFACLNVL